jgi:putative inorganic carbon (hco3(-)) transporter
MRILDQPGVVVALLLGAVMAVQLLRKVEFGLAALVFGIASATPELLERRSGLPNFTLPLALVVGALAFRHRRWHGQTGPRQVGALGCAFLALLIAEGCSIFVATDTDGVRERFLDDVRSVVVMLAIAFSLTTVRQLRWLAHGAIAAGAVMGAAAVAQFAIGGTGEMFFGLASAPELGGFGTTESARASGPMVSTNYFAQYLVVLTAIALERSIRDRDRRMRRWSAISVCLMIPAILLTSSRGGLVGLVVVLGVGVAWLRAGRRLVIPLVLVALGSFLLAPSGMAERFGAIGDIAGPHEAIADNAVRGRLSEMRAAYDMFVDRPLFGVGVANFDDHYPEYADRLGLEDDPLGRSAHNLPLHFAAELGLVGLAMFAVLVGGAARGLARARRRARLVGDRELAGLAQGIQLGLVGFLATAMFLHLSHPQLFWLLVTLGWVAPQIRAEPDGAPTSESHASASPVVVPFAPVRA